jgi:hypothetical protein
VDFEWIKVVDFFFELSSLGRLAMSMEVLGTQTGTHKLRKEREACLQKTVAGGLL